MTTNEAINWIKEHHCPDNFKSNTDDANAMRIAIKALKRMTPTLVTHEATLYKCCTCPCCKNVVDEFTDLFGHKVRVEASYCKFCGQALLWEEN